MAIALLLVLVVVGSVLFHVLSPWWWTPIASNWDYIDHTLVITFWITGVVFAAVVLFMAYCVWRFRHKEGSRAHYEPESKRLETWLTVVTGIGVAGPSACGRRSTIHLLPSRRGRAARPLPPLRRKAAGVPPTCATFSNDARAGADKVARSKRAGLSKTSQSAPPRRNTARPAEAGSAGGGSGAGGP